MTIAIKYDDSTGRITNRYYDAAPDSMWTETADADWPTVDAGPDEVPRFYYDESTGDISVQYETVQTQQ